MAAAHLLEPVFNDLARWINLVVAGWINYYSRFRQCDLHPLCEARQRLPSAPLSWTPSSCLPTTTPPWNWSTPSAL